MDELLEDDFLDCIPQSLLDMERESTSLVASLEADLNDSFGPKKSAPQRRGVYKIEGPISEDITDYFPQPLLELHIANEKTKLSTASARTLAQEIDWSVLLKLNIQNQPLGPRGVLPLANGWKALIHLTIEGCRLGHFGMQALGPMLPSTLRELNLANNAIGRDGAWKLASFLPPDLHALDLSRNGIGDEGCAALCPNHLPDRILRLTHNQIGDSGAKTLAAALREQENPKLQELCLASNEIGEEGATALTEVLDHATSLRVLDLKENGLSDSRLQFADVILKHRPTDRAHHQESPRKAAVPSLLQYVLDIDDKIWKEQASAGVVSGDLGRQLRTKLQSMLSALDER